MLDGFAGFSFCFGILILMAIGAVLRGIRLLYEYERGVVFTLGKYSGTRDPGLTIVIPVFQTMQKVDMRIKTAEIPRQEVMTRDNIPMLVNAVVYFKVIKPAEAIINFRINSAISIVKTPVHQGMHPLTFLWQETALAGSQPALGIISPNANIAVQPGNVDITDHQQLLVR